MPNTTNHNIPPLLTSALLNMVQTEATGAHIKHGSNSMLYATDERALAILMEEVGECAREMNELALGNRTPEDYKYMLVIELVQVAAMALTWAHKEIVADA
jgi:hypothetical protein